MEPLPEASAQIPKSPLPDWGVAHMVPQQAATTPTHQPPGCVTPRVEIPHYLLRMADAGLIVRRPVTLMPSGITTWEVRVDGKPAPESARWGVSAIDEWEFISWHGEGNRQVAIPTPGGADTLTRWDAELFGADGSDAPDLSGGES